MLKMMLLGLLSLSLFGSSGVHAFEGVYAGQMHLKDGFERDIPLQVSFINTGETMVLPNGEVRQVLQGSFLMDGEGGPFSFSNVSLKIENGWIEMKYYRPSLEVGGNNPANLRFFGTFQEDGTILGNVYSATWGNIGSFDVRKSERSSFSSQNTYDGTWSGTLEQLDNSEKRDIVISISSIGGVTQTPPDYETDYTPAKTASIKIGAVQFRLNRVHIDYLRRKLVLAYTDNKDTDKLIFELNYNPKDGSLSGIQSGVWAGKKARVVLNRKN